MTTVPLDIRTIRIVALPDPAWLAGFESGESEIDRSIDRCCERHATYRSRTFCAFAEGQQTAFGFYNAGVSAHDSKYLQDLTTDPSAFIPFIYLNYLGVRKEYQNQKVGTLLLGHFLQRCAQVVFDVGGIYGAALHALTDRVAGLYDNYGFREYKGGRSKYPFMILPAKSLIDLGRMRP